PRARYKHPFPSYLSKPAPSPAQASSAIACNVSNASHIRQSRPSATSSSEMPARSQKSVHSSTRSSGSVTSRSSSQTVHCRLASSTASDQLGKRIGGHALLQGGDKTNR